MPSVGAAADQDLGSVGPYPGAPSAGLARKARRFRRLPSRFTLRTETESSERRARASSGDIGCLNWSRRSLDMIREVEASMDEGNKMISACVLDVLIKATKLSLLGARRHATQAQGEKR